MRVILNSIGVIRKQAMVKHYKGYKIFDTMHDRQKFYLVFDPNNEVVFKTTKLENADNFIHSSQGAEKHNR